LIGGAVAGATVAARTRSRMQVFGMAGLVSVFCAVAEYSRTWSAFVRNCDRRISDTHVFW